MGRLLTLACALLALASCDTGGHTNVVRTTRNGTDILYSKVHRTEASVEFHCIASVTGVCHYALFEHGCPATGPCDLKPYHRFGVRAGERLYDTTLKSTVVECVSAEADTPADNCPKGNGRA